MAYRKRVGDVIRYNYPGDGKPPRSKVLKDLISKNSKTPTYLIEYYTQSSLLLASSSLSVSLSASKMLLKPSNALWIKFWRESITSSYTWMTCSWPALPRINTKTTSVQFFVLLKWTKKKKEKRKTDKNDLTKSG